MLPFAAVEAKPGLNEATVTVLPSITAALPLVKFVALVLMMSTFEVVPGSIFALSGGKNENPITSPTGELRSLGIGGTVPLAKKPVRPPSGRKAKLVIQVEK